MPILSFKWGNLFYEITGKGCPLALIHGAWASHIWWQRQVQDLSAKYKVLSFDLRGHGQSGPLPQGSSLRDFVSDLEVLFQELALEEVVLIGWSLGGMVALEYGWHHPQQVKGMILISTRGQRPSQGKARIWHSYLRAHLNLAIDLYAPRKFDRQKESFPDGRELFERELKNFFPPSISQEIYELIMNNLKNYSPANYKEIAKILWTWEIEEEKLKKVAIPTLIMSGLLDKITPPSFSKFLHERIPNSELIFIEDAGHLLPLERPREVNAYIFDFLKKINY